MKLIQHFCFIYCICLLASCANESSPQGGPKDSAPPKLLTRSVKDSVVQYKGGQVIFEFDEKIDPKSILVETFPIMIAKPKVDVNKNKVILSIPDSLLEPNTTYKISLGNSVADIYEGNQYNNLQFTFSTGLALDTLSSFGAIFQSATGEPDTSAYAFLYSVIKDDSDILSKKPLYAAKANAEGIFNITNLPNKEFYIYAIGDANKNLKLDYPLEKIGFNNTTILPLAEKKSLLKLFTFDIPQDTLRKNVGRLGSVIPANAIPRFSTNIDTSEKVKRTFDITKPIQLSFANKLIKWDQTKIRLFTDSLLDETGIVTFDSVKKSILINIDYNQDAVYKLQLLDSFAMDTIGYFLSKEMVFRTKKESDFGTLKIKYPLDFAQYNHVIRLSLNGNVIAKQIIKDSVIQFQLLNPGTYSLSILNDKNNNEIWDPGYLFINKKQPEIVEKFKGDVIIKSNWQNIIEWK